MNGLNIYNHHKTSLNVPATQGLLDTFHPIGFKGYRLDKASGLYILGNGYRMYNPIMRAFYSPDSESPFGIGGLSRYAYCGFDPVNFSDPGGHMSVGAGIGIGLGILGILLSAFTLGSSLAMLSTGLLVSGISGVASGVLVMASAATGIASATLEDSDPAMSAALGWASLGLGIGGMVAGGISAGANYAVRSTAMRNIPLTSLPAAQVRQVGAAAIVGNRIRDMHGYPFNVLLKHGGQHAFSGRGLGRTVGSYLRETGDITLTACFGGYGGRISAAQLLANQTGRTVHAASGFHTALYDATTAINRTFTPLTGVARSLSDTCGLLASGLIRGGYQGVSGLFSALPPTIWATSK